MNELNPKQKAFVREYVKDWNATQAAIRAGYSAHTAKAQGSRLLTNDDIAAEIQKIKVKAEKKTDITTEYVLTSLKSVAQRCQQKELVEEFDRELGQYVPEIEVVETTCPSCQHQFKIPKHVYKFDSSGANKALELLGKNLSLFSDRLIHSGSLTLEQLVADEENYTPMDTTFPVNGFHKNGHTNGNGNGHNGKS